MISQILHARGKKPHSTDQIGEWAGARTGLVTLKWGGTLVPVGNPTTIPPSSSTQPIHYTDYANLAPVFWQTGTHVSKELVTSVVRVEKVVL